MIIPIRCHTCGLVLANKWKKYQEKVLNQEMPDNTESENVLDKCFEQNLRGKVLEELGITKMCCKRHMLTHVDIIDTF